MKFYDFISYQTEIWDLKKLEVWELKIIYCALTLVNLLFRWKSIIEAILNSREINLFEVNKVVFTNYNY
jgi:hypothetical protein